MFINIPDWQLQRREPEWCWGRGHTSSTGRCPPVPSLCLTHRDLSPPGIHRDQWHLTPWVPLMSVNRKQTCLPWHTMLSCIWISLFYKKHCWHFTECTQWIFLAFTSTVAPNAILNSPLASLENTRWNVCLNSEVLNESPITMWPLWREKHKIRKLWQNQHIL